MSMSDSEHNPVCTIEHNPIFINSDHNPILIKSDHNPILIKSDHNPICIIMQGVYEKNSGWIRICKIWLNII